MKPEILSIIECTIHHDLTDCHQEHLEQKTQVSFSFLKSMNLIIRIQGLACFNIGQSRKLLVYKANHYT